MYRFSYVLLLCVAALQATPYKDCGSKSGHYQTIVVSGCPETDRQCILKRDSNATIQILFNTVKDVTAVKSVVHGVISGVPVPFPIRGADACADTTSGLSCPLKNGGGPYWYSHTLFVEKMYPRLTLDVKWELKDQDDEDIVCIAIPAKIQ